MVNMADCIARAVDFGEIDAARGQAATDEYNQLLARYSTILPEAEAMRRASLDLKEATNVKLAERRHKVINQLLAMQRIRNLVETAPDPAAAIRNLLEYSEGSGFRGEAVKSLQEAYNASIAADLAEVLEQVGLNVTGASRDALLLERIVKEAHGEATGDAVAKGYAGAVARVQERMRRLFNAHGGNIGKLDNYGLPHSHDPAALLRAGFEAWADRIEPLIAWNRIPDLATGRPFADAPGTVPPRMETERFLREVYDGITMRGWDDRDPSMAVGGRALYATRAEHRVLHFRDGTAWLDYNREFGASDPFSAMMGGLHGLARDVAMMRVLGPNPKLGLDYAAQVAQRRAADLRDARLQDRARKAHSRARAMLAHVNGSANVPESVGWASFFAGTRAVLTSIQLGSAVVSSVTDFGTMAMAARQMGINPRNVIGRSVQLMASQATRDTARRMGYVAGALADAGGGYSRFMGQTLGRGIPERLAGFTLRATGLSFVTDTRKMAFQMEFAGHMAEQADRAFADLDAPLRNLFTERGITAADWDALRDPATRFVTDDGADFISPMYWLETQTAMPRVEAEGLAMRLQMAIQEQLEFAIPTASLEGRTFFVGESRPGTFLGELARSSVSYKSFAMSLTLGQYRRFMALPTRVDRAIYAARMSAMLIGLGALAVQLKELTKGNDPRPMTDPAFWGAALMQGGGLGIFGDFFSGATNRMGGSFAQTLAGPVVGAMNSAATPIVSNLARAVQGEDTSLGADAVQFARRNTPFLSSAWYARTAYDRLVMDQLAILIDPKAEAKFRQAARRIERENGTRQYWPSGRTAPARAPDLGNAMRETP